VKGNKALQAGTAISEKRVGVVGFLLVVILAKESVTADNHKSLFSLAIAPSRKAAQPGVAFWKAGDPVFMILTMNNDSKRVLHFALTHPHPHPAFDCRTEVRDAQGLLVPETEHPPKLRENLQSGFLTTRNGLVTPKPQETCQDLIVASYLYDVSRPGPYSVQLERDLPLELGQGVVKSNHHDDHNCITLAT
jgi:hypothetical protein